MTATALLVLALVVQTPEIDDRMLDAAREATGKVAKLTWTPHTFADGKRGIVTSDKDGQHFIKESVKCPTYLPTSGTWVKIFDGKRHSWRKWMRGFEVMYYPSGAMTTPPIGDDPIGLYSFNGIVPEQIEETRAKGTVFSSSVGPDDEVTPDDPPSEVKPDPLPAPNPSPNVAVSPEWLLAGAAVLLILSIVAAILVALS